MTTTQESTGLARRGEQNQAIEERTQKGLTLEMVSEMTGYELAQITMERVLPGRCAGLHVDQDAASPACQMRGGAGITEGLAGATRCRAIGSGSGRRRGGRVGRSEPSAAHR